MLSFEHWKTCSVIVDITFYAQHQTIIHITLCMLFSRCRDLPSNRKDNTQVPCIYTYSGMLAIARSSFVWDLRLHEVEQKMIYSKKNRIQWGIFLKVKLRRNKVNKTGSFFGNITVMLVITMSSWFLGVKLPQCVNCDIFNLLLNWVQFVSGVNKRLVFTGTW